MPRSLIFPFMLFVVFFIFLNTYNLWTKRGIESLGKQLLVAALAAFLVTVVLAVIIFFFP